MAGGGGKAHGGGLVPTVARATGTVRRLDARGATHGAHTGMRDGVRGGRNPRGARQGCRWLERCWEDH